MRVRRGFRSVLAGPLYAKPKSRFDAGEGCYTTPTLQATTLTDPGSFRAQSRRRAWIATTKRQPLHTE